MTEKPFDGRSTKQDEPVRGSALKEPLETLNAMSAEQYDKPVRESALTESALDAMVAKQHDDLVRKFLPPPYTASRRAEIACANKNRLRFGSWCVACSWFGKQWQPLPRFQKAPWGGNLVEYSDEEALAMFDFEVPKHTNL